jgi:N-acetylglutamate synthase-like GNAT family acetyltransferase
MDIRNAKLKDTEEILNLLIKTPELQGYGEMDAVYSEDYVIDCIEDKNINLILVAEEDDKIVGLLIAEIWDKKKYSFFVNFVVLPDYRSKGIGTKLYQAYEEHCKKHHLKTITALVQRSNKVMQQFCEKKEYKKGHELYFYEKDI